MRRLLTAAAAALALGGCATRPAGPLAAPAPPAPPPAGAAPAPLPVPAARANWEDMAATPGDWRFAASPAPEAIYGEGAASAFRLHCDSAGRRVVLTRLDAGAAAALTVRTSFGVRQLPLSAGSAALPAADALLDDIVSSRGRFAVEADGLPGLILPTWPEPARVIEECRG